ncbi:MAG TPA: glycogen-binding domain-containing protein [Gemmatimonadales bacterium]|nr:glycogen-binding domain-containing protein [Gemmatimonadales bacterium]
MLRPYLFVPYFAPVKRAVIVSLAAIGMGAAPGVAQTEASLGLGVGTVRYAGGSSFGSAIVSPTLRFSRSQLVAEATGAVASLPFAWSSQARASVWGVAARLPSRLQLAGEATVVGTTLSGGGPSTAAAHGVGEVLWTSPTWGMGVGAGPSTGMISGALPVVALHTRARAWWRPGTEDDTRATELQLVLEPTHFPDGWFTDVGAGANVERGRVVASIWLAGRLAGGPESKAAGSALIQMYVTPRVSIELGGGSYLNDPYQDLPRAGFVTLGVRLHRSTHPIHATPVPRLAPLSPEIRGDSQVVQFRMPRAKRVAMAGDWNAWQPLALRPLGDDVWEAALRLKRGVYHFNLVVDGSDWVVPNGVATVSDGMGGMVAVLIVP